MGKKAKKADIIDFLRNIVTVNSNAYKKHVRAKRGTYTAISLPKALKTNSDSQKLVNRQAKHVFDKIKEIAFQFKDSKLWPRLLSALRKSGSAINGRGYFGLEGFEVRKEYPSDVILGLVVEFDEDKPIFDYNLPSNYQVDIHMCILEVDATFEHVVDSYEWHFSLMDSVKFDFDEIKRYRVENGVYWTGYERGSRLMDDGLDEVDESLIGTEGASFDAARRDLSAVEISEGMHEEISYGGAAVQYVNELDDKAQLQVKEFVYDVEKKGRYVAIISVNKILNGNADTGLTMRGMRLDGL